MRVSGNIGTSDGEEIQMNINFSKNVEAASKIADRADAAFVRKAGGRMSFMMDLLAADGENGNEPIDLDALANADDFNFAHDAYGISRYINRETGKLTQHFLPRYARKSVSA